MTAVFITPLDLEPFADIESAKAAAMIEDAMAMAARVAPCILEDDFPHIQAARAVLRAAILRWHEAGTGALVQSTVGGVSDSFDNRQVRRGMFWPSEIRALSELCSDSSSAGRAFQIDTAPETASSSAVTDSYPWYPSDTYGYGW